MFQDREMDAALHLTNKGSQCCGVNDLGPSCKNAWSAATCVPKSYARLTAVGEFVFFCTLWSIKSNTRHYEAGNVVDDVVDDDDDDDDAEGKLKMPWYGILGSEMLCVCVLAWKFRVHRVHAQTSPVKKRGDVAGRCCSWKIQILWWLGPEKIFQKSGSSRTCGQQNGGMQRIFTYV